MKRTNGESTQLEWLHELSKEIEATARQVQTTGINNGKALPSLWHEQSKSHHLARVTKVVTRQEQ